MIFRVPGVAATCSAIGLNASPFRAGNEEDSQSFSRAARNKRSALCHHAAKEANELLSDVSLFAMQFATGGTLLISGPQKAYRRVCLTIPITNRSAWMEILLYCTPDDLYLLNGIPRDSEIRRGALPSTLRKHSISPAARHNIRYAAEQSSCSSHNYCFFEERDVLSVWSFHLLTAFRPVGKSKLSEAHCR